MKKSLIFALVFMGFTSLNAAKINSVVALVNNEPITSYELSSAMAKTGGNYGQAFDMLVSEKLQNAEIKRLKINVTPYEVEEQIRKIAAQNNISVDTMKQQLARSGKSYDSFRAQIANDMKMSKFYQSALSGANAKITKENVRAFYERNKKLFSKFTGVRATAYVARTPDVLQNVMKNGSRASNGPDLLVQKINLGPGQMNEQAYAFFSQLKEGAFTPIRKNNAGYYEMFYLNKKVGLVTMPFEQVEQEALSMYANMERQKEAEMYFEKLKSKAIVEILNRK